MRSVLQVNQCAIIVFENMMSMKRNIAWAASIAAEAERNLTEVKDFIL